MPASFSLSMRLTEIYQGRLIFLFTQNPLHPKLTVHIYLVLVDTHSGNFAAKAFRNVYRIFCWHIAKAGGSDKVIG